MIELESKDICGLLSEWFNSKNFVDIEFKENLNPAQDKYARYQIAYEAIFTPIQLDRASIEIWLTTDGNIAIGVEKWARIAKRINVNCRKNQFAAGHEPNLISGSGLLAVMELVANGRVAISARAIPLFGLISTKAIVCDDDLVELKKRGYSYVKWVHGVNYTKFHNNSNLLRFRSWAV